MHDFFPLFAQAGVVAFQAVWLSFAAYDNITHSAVNERGFGHVLRMDLVEKEDPETYKEFSGRRVENPATEMALFKALVAGETIVAVLLWLGALALLLAAFGVIGHAGARALAMMAVLGFTAIWASLLTGGRWFMDRIGMAGAVTAHSLLAIWGTVTLGFLAVVP